MPRILVVEDDVSLREAICELLNDEQYESTPCMDGEVAIHLAISGSYDLILLDGLLPDLDGWGGSYTPS
ncbi:MAG: response regulator [Acidibacillus sp.]|nr:response regulator [Acidibacillus sp.]